MKKIEMGIICAKCPYLLYKLNACSSLEYSFQNLTDINYICENLFEIFMVILSLGCYFLMGLIVLFFLLEKKFNKKYSFSTFYLTPITALLFSELIKNLMKEKRPENSCSKNNGFPSHHSVFISCFFFEVFKFLKIKIKNRFILHLLKRMLFSFSFFVCYSRYYLNYHTIRQISAGLIIGTVFHFILNSIKLK